MNCVSYTQVFNATNGVAAAVDISYGSNWQFYFVDFEAVLTRAVRARGIFEGSFEHCWFEDLSDPHAVLLAECAAPNAQGCPNWRMENCFGALFNVTTCLVSMVFSSAISFANCAFLAVGNGVRLTDNPARVYGLQQVSAINGAGAALFLLGHELSSLNQNTLPIGPVGIGQANLTNNGFTSKTDVASAIGLTEQAVRFVLSNGGNAAYYTIPAKLLDFLKGKYVTLAVTGYGDTAGAEVLAAAIWQSVGAPSQANATTSAGAGMQIVVSSSALQTTYATLFVSGGATSLAVGVLAGGNANTRTVTIESMRLMLGIIAPQSAGLK